MLNGTQKKSAQLTSVWWFYLGMRDSGLRLYSALSLVGISAGSVTKGHLVRWHGAVSRLNCMLFLNKGGIGVSVFKAVI